MGGVRKKEKPVIFVLKYDICDVKMHENRTGKQRLDKMTLMNTLNRIREKCKGQSEW